MAQALAAAAATDAASNTGQNRAQMQLAKEQKPRLLNFSVGDLDNSEWKRVQPLMYPVTKDLKSFEQFEEEKKKIRARKVGTS